MIPRAAAAFGIILAARATAASGGVLLALVVARVGGADLLGQFTFAMAVAVALAMLAKFGLDQCIMRTAARWVAEDRPQLLSPGLRHVLGRVVLASAVILGLYLAALAAGVFPRSGFLLGWLAPLVVIVAVMTVFSGYMKGRKRASEAVLYEIGGMSLLAAGVLALLQWSGFSLPPQTIAGVTIGCCALVAVLAGHRSFADAAGFGSPGPLDRWEAAQLVTGWQHFTLIALAGFLTQAGSFVIAGPFLTDTELGLARAAERLAVLIGLPVTIIVPYLAPRFVEADNREDIPRLRRLLRLGLMVSAAMAMPGIVLCLAFPQTLLSFFGEDFADARPALMIMAGGQLALALGGPVQLLLNMLGHERVSASVQIASLMACVVLYPLGAVMGGTPGFATAIAVVAIIRMIALFWLAAVRVPRIAGFLSR